jgi:tRNAThr (cytosine32-N3)-methyltransferase
MLSSTIKRCIAIRTTRRMTTTMDTPGSIPEAGPSSPPKVLTAYDKWHKKNGPPVGSSFGARKLGEGEDPYAFNAWYVWTPGRADGRDHAELPDDFEERAAEIEDTHRANPVKEELRGGSGYYAPGMGRSWYRRYI